MPTFTTFLHTTLAMGCLVVATAHLGHAQAQTTDDLVLEARDALTKKNKARLDTLKTATDFAKHPLASWVAYWELTNRLNEAQQPELDAFYARWANTYVEDRLRNDWLLELGRRRDWANFSRDLPGFRMADDREVVCYQLFTQHLAGQDVKAAAYNAWALQRSPDDGCQFLASSLFAAGVFKEDDVWAAIQHAAEFDRPRVVRLHAALLGEATAKRLTDAMDQPARLLGRKPDDQHPRLGPALAHMAVLRLAAADPVAAAEQLANPWARRLGPARAAHAWAVVGRYAAARQVPEALSHYTKAWTAWGQAQAAGAPPTAWTDELLAWQVRAALRSGEADATRWTAVLQATNAMSAAEQREPTWAYWRTRAQLALAATEAERSSARAALEALASAPQAALHFYGQLALEDLGRRPMLPPAPPPPTSAEKQAVRAVPGFQRALMLIDLGLRNEGVREWNYTLRGLNDRELLAAAQWACEREVWDRCINTSERTRTLVDLQQRYPTPFRQEVLAKAQQVGVDPAYVYGLVRQESRFIINAKSHVGAAGLMQVMPNTAKWTAKRIGLAYTPDMLTDRDVNLLLGTSYLKIVLDDMGGSQALAAAAYNAGPNRPRRWRDGPPVEAAAWAESVPFNETRDYVKKVLANGAVYAALFSGQAVALKPRLGPAIGPRDPNAPPSNGEIP
ncbi:MAG: transglycosylase SLT domain-containing protein [Rubrivivax sp.]